MKLLVCILIVVSSQPVSAAVPSDKPKAILDQVPKIEVVKAAFAYIKQTMGPKCGPWQVIAEKSGADHIGFAIKRECTRTGGEGSGSGTALVEVEGTIETFKGKLRSGISNIKFDYGL